MGTRCFGGVVGGHALDGEAQDLAGLLSASALVRLGIANDDGRFAGDLVVDSLQQLLFLASWGSCPQRVEGPLISTWPPAMALMVLASSTSRLRRSTCPCKDESWCSRASRTIDAAIEGFLALGDAVLS